MKVNGKKIDIRNVSVPLLIIDAEKDDLVSTDSSIAVAEYVSSSTEFWRSSLIENVFDLNISNPRQLEQKAKDEISDEKVKKSTLIITSIEDCIKSIEEYSKQASQECILTAPVRLSLALSSHHHQHAMNNNKKPTIDSVTPSEVNYVMRQLKTAGIPIP